MRLLTLALVSVSVLCCSGETSNIRPKISFPTGDIINGHEAVPHSAPYIVSLKSLSHFCAGTIIDARWVLTAAHCLIYKKFQVVAGLHNRLNQTGSVVVRSVKAGQYFRHKLYGGGVGDYDIGLIRIRPPFVLNDSVNKVNLPAANKNHSGEGVLFGWGRSNGGNLPINLQTVNTLIIPYDKCRTMLPSDAPIEPTNVCSNSDVNNGTSISACNGDSGGPLVQYVNGGTVAEHVGIVSWGYVPCGASNMPSVYTHTSAYVDWIRQNVK